MPFFTSLKTTHVQTNTLLIICYDVTFPLKGWVGGFGPFWTEKNSSFKGGYRCVVRAMAETDLQDGSWTDVGNSTVLVEPFESFSGDLLNLQKSSELDKSAVDFNSAELFQDHEAVRRVETESVFSPTTIATADAYGDFHTQHARAVSSTLTGETHDEIPVRFDTALERGFQLNGRGSASANLGDRHLEIHFWR